MQEKLLSETEARLGVWSTEIERRAAILVPIAGKARFAALQHVDELKVLYATALASFDTLRSMAAGNRTGPAAALAAACNDLATALRGPMPRP